MGLIQTMVRTTNWLTIVFSYTYDLSASQLSTRCDALPRPSAGTIWYGRKYCVVCGILVYLWSVITHTQLSFIYMYGTLWVKIYDTCMYNLSKGTAPVETFLYIFITRAALDKGYMYLCITGAALVKGYIYLYISVTPLVKCHIYLYITVTSLVQGYIYIFIYYRCSPN